MENEQAPKKYPFNLTLEESDLVVQGLAHLPLGKVEGLVGDLRNQFAVIIKGIEAEEKKKKPYKKNPKPKKKK